ncbi:MAG: hypothetical protein AB1416_08410, partial [Actinomycetota bacterium]
MPPLPPGRHLDLLLAALGTEERAQRALLAGDREAALPEFARAADLYRLSWRVAPPRSYGRLIGMLKAAVIAGDAQDEAIYALASAGTACDSPPAAYVVALAATVRGDDDLARRAARAMRGGDGAFSRTAAALEALANHDVEGYRTALREIVASFEEREEHLTGVAIADTAVMLDALAAARG